MKFTRTGKKMAILAIILAILLCTPLLFAADENEIHFLPADKHVEIGSSFTMNINATIYQAVDTVAVDNMTFDGTVITTESSNVTAGNLFENGTIDDIVTVDNTNGYISSIVWANETINQTTGTLANITWYALAVGTTQVNMTAGGTANNGTDPATINHSCNITVHPKPTTGFSSQANTTSLIYLSWTKQLGGDTVSVFAKEDSAPTGYDDVGASNIYNGTANNYEHSVSAEEHWYYLVYSWNTSESLYSLTTETDDTTTDSDYAGPNWYVSNDGADSNDGSIGSPWQTLDKVTTEQGVSGDIDIGDNIYFNRDDTFVGELDLRKGGTEADPMVIGAYGTGADPIINNSGGASDGNAVTIWYGSGGNFTIENLDIQGTDSNRNGIDIGLNGRTNVVIRNCTFSNLEKFAVYARLIDGLTIEHCNSTGGGFYLEGDSNEILANTTIHHCIINANGESSSEGLVYHRDDSQNGMGSGHYIHNNTVYNTHSGDKNYVFGCGSDFLVEYNYAWGTGQAAYGINHDVTNLTIQNCVSNDSGGFGIIIETVNNVIVRNNLVINSTYDPISFETNDGSGWANEDGYTKNCTIYNNNFIVPSDWNSVNRIISTQADYFDDTYLKNNLIVSFSSNPTFLYNAYVDTIPPSSELTFDTNIWYHGSGSSSSRWNSSTVIMSLSSWQSHYPNDFFDDPELSSVTNNNYSLNASSPCIDAGTYLTETSDSGTDSIFTVDDASYFMDGFGLINGDIITVGSETNLMVTEVDYFTNQITVNRSFTWSDDDDVNLDYNGSAPDIGYLESARDMSVSNIFPSNGATEVTRPPTNLSAYVTGSNLDIYIYFVNMTPTTNTWTLVQSWSDQSTGRFAATSLNTFGRTTEFIWGNTTYTWSVNITDGSSWLNNTYTYDTIASVLTKNARCDVNNDDEVKGNDLLLIYAYRDGNPDGYLYDGFYDVNEDNEIKGTDILFAYANST